MCLRVRMLSNIDQKKNVDGRALHLFSSVVACVVEAVVLR
jgi:hypothetical protein